METEILVPNLEFRNEVVSKGADTLNLCFMCGTCTGSCPSGKFTVFRTRNLIRLAQLGIKEEVLPSDMLWHCTTCYTCHERCPRGVEIPNIIYTLRNMAVKEGHMGKAHQKVAGFLIKTGHLVPLSDQYKKARLDLGLEEVPPTTMKHKDALKAVQDIMKKTGFDELIGEAEK